MKLVEILACEWRGWPVQEYLPVSQDAEGGLYVSAMFTESGKTLRLDEEADLAEDMATAEVTRPQWQAERDRMRKMEALIEARDNPPSTEPTYEQQLWDRVAVAATQAFITAHITHFGHENVWQDKELVSCAADYADAFMAERAKRVGK